MKINTKLSSSSAADEELDEQLSPRGLSGSNNNSNHYHHHSSNHHQGSRGGFFASAQRNNHHHRPIKTSISSLSGLNDQDCDELLQDQSPPNSPALRLPPHCFSSNSSISSWKSRSSPSGSDSSSEDGDSQELCNNLISSQGSNSGGSSNNKDDRMSYSTKFARYHLETYRQNDRMRWNFDFEHNRPLDDQHHHHHQAVARYQWEPAI